MKFTFYIYRGIINIPGVQFLWISWALFINEFISSTKKLIYFYVLIEREREGERDREKKELPEVLDVLFLPTMKACSFFLCNDN